MEGSPILSFARSFRQRSGKCKCFSTLQSMKACSRHKSTVGTSSPPFESPGIASRVNDDSESGSDQDGTADLVPSLPQSPTLVSSELCFVPPITAAEEVEEALVCRVASRKNRILTGWRVLEYRPSRPDCVRAPSGPDRAPNDEFLPSMSDFAEEQYSSVILNIRELVVDTIQRGDVDKKAMSSANHDAGQNK